MPKRVDSIPDDKRGQSKSKYEYLLNGEAYLFERDEFPDGNPTSVRTYLYQYADKNRMRARIRVRPEGMYVQFTKKEDRP